MMGLFNHKKQAGFSLTEMLVVVLLIGVVSAMALPMYTNYVRRGYRADAQAALLEAAVRMQRHFTANNSYSTPAPVDATIFGGSTVIPANAANPMYNLSISAVAAGTYTLQAVPVGTQFDDDCGTMRVQSSGLKEADLADCW